MSDRDALLRAICENPADDAPRLAYADWLDEHGDPRQAEFVRVQIELAGGPATAQRFGTLRKREDELWGGMKKWRYLPANWISLCCTDFKRGFNTSWVGRVTDFLAVSPNLCRHGPLETLRLSFDSVPVPPISAAQAVAACPVLGCLTELSLSGQHLTEQWVNSLLASPFAGRWPSLTLSGDDLSDAVCDGLAASPLAHSECRVVLRSRNLTRRGAALMERLFGYSPPASDLGADGADDVYDADFE